MTAYYNEIDPYAAAWLGNLIAAGHIAPGIVDTRSIEDVSPDDVRGFTQCHWFAGIGVWSYALRRAGWGDDRPVWTGSCPCQPFSSAGKAAGFGDERHLWPSFYWLIGQCAPPVVLGEQVASKYADAWIDLVQADLEAVGYVFGCVPFPAASVGAPHIRDRSYWVAYASGSGQSWSSGRCAPQEQRASELCRTGGLADMRGQGFPVGSIADDGRGALRDERSTVAARLVSGGLADDDDDQRRESLRDVRLQRQYVHDADGCGETVERPGPTNGWWSDPDWLFCRDERWRPVEPSHVKMVDGVTSSVGYMRSGDDSQTKEIARAVLQDMLETSRSEALPVGSFGGQRVFQPEGILRPQMHGGGLRGHNQGDERQEQSSSEREDPTVDMQPLRTESASRSPSGREPAEQRPVEFGELVRLLPSSLALAERYADDRPAAELCALLETIRALGPVLHASHPVQEIWSSLGQETKDLVRMAFDDPRWQIVAPFPLAHNAPSRVGRLRAYGNAIVGPQAETFIRAVMECRP